MQGYGRAEGHVLSLHFQFVIGGDNLKKLLVVDGSNLLFQMFFGMPSRIINSQGKAIQGTLGFVGALLKILRMVSPTHAVVLFDGQHENPRCFLNADYKANRPDYSTVPEDENPFSQLPDVYAALKCMGVKCFETTCCETDDLIASYAITYGESESVVISSFDSDFFQLINENVSILRYRAENTVICNTEYIKKKFGIAPYQYADFKSLVGDSADNIKGAEKIGVKTAAMLLNQFETLDGIIKSAEKIEKNCVRASVIANAERLYTNLKIVRLSNTEKIPFLIDELEYIPIIASTTEILRKIGLR